MRTRKSAVCLLLVSLSACIGGMAMAAAVSDPPRAEFQDWPSFTAPESVPRETSVDRSIRDLPNMACLVIADYSFAIAPAIVIPTMAPLQKPFEFATASIESGTSISYHIDFMEHPPCHGALPG